VSVLDLAAVQKKREEEISYSFLLKILAAKATAAIANALVLTGIIGLLTVGLGAIIGFAALGILSPISLLAFSVGASALGALLIVASTFANNKLGRPTNDVSSANQALLKRITALQEENTRLKASLQCIDTVRL
jgi:hypothetical protein